MNLCQVELNKKMNVTLPQGRLLEYPPLLHIYFDILYVALDYWGKKELMNWDISDIFKENCLCGRQAWTQVATN